MKKILLYFILAALSFTVNATTYYVSNSGNDSANGTTTSTTWLTVAKVNATTFTAGDQILFKRGGIWREKLNPKSGSSGAYMYYGAYDTGAKPLFLGSKQENNASDWVDQGGNIWQNSDASFTVDVANLIFNNESSCGFKVMSATPTLDSQGKFWYDHTNDRIRIYSVGNPATFYSNIECALKGNALGMSSVSYVTFQNLDFRYWGTCVWESGGNYITFRDCDLSYIGGADQSSNYTMRYGNGLQMWEGCHDITIERCKIDNVYDAGITPQGYSGGYAVYNLYIRNNIISNCEYSLEFFARDATASAHDIHFENNTCAYAGGGFGHNQRTGSAAGMHLMMREITASKSNIFIRNNIFYNATQYIVRIEYSDTDASGFDDLQNITFDNNVYYQGNGYGSYAFKTWGNIVYNYAQWLAETGMDTHSVNSDPLFISPTDFNLQSTSPAINAGVNVALTTDYLGNQIVGVPDIGAYEYIPPVIPVIRTKGISGGNGKVWGKNGIVYGTN